MQAYEGGHAVADAVLEDRKGFRYRMAQTLLGPECDNSALRIMP